MIPARRSPAGFISIEWKPPIMSWPVNWHWSDKNRWLIRPKVAGGWMAVRRVNQRLTLRTNPTQFLMEVWYEEIFIKSAFVSHLFFSSAMLVCTGTNSIAAQPISQTTASRFWFSGGLGNVHPWLHSGKCQCQHSIQTSIVFSARHCQFWVPIWWSFLRYRIACWPCHSWQKRTCFSSHRRGDGDRIAKWGTWSVWTRHWQRKNWSHVWFANRSVVI